MLGALYAGRGRRHFPTSTVMVIKEGRFSGEPVNGIVCPNCGRRFKHNQMFKEELIKCPFCGNVVE